MRTLERSSLRERDSIVLSVFVIARMSKAEF